MRKEKSLKSDIQLKFLCKNSLLLSQLCLLTKYWHKGKIVKKKNNSKDITTAGKKNTICTKHLYLNELHFPC